MKNHASENLIHRQKQFHKANSLLCTPCGSSAYTEKHWQFIMLKSLGIAVIFSSRSIPIYYLFIVQSIFKKDQNQKH